MARNRKRAKERRDRRPQTVGSRSSARGTGPAAENVPAPLGHAAPDTELADAQLALGSIEQVADGPAASLEAGEAPEPSGEGGGGDAVRIDAGFDGDDDGMPPSGGAVPLPEAHVRPRNRLIAFLEGSWRELQRVQWPDRRQVMQATAVVLGFVIVAGLVLAVADTLASHLMSYVLTGTHSVLAWVAVGVIVLSLAGWMLADRDR